MKLSQEEINAIMSIAAKIIEHQETSRTKKEINKIVRNSEDEYDMTARLGPKSCEDCDD